MHRDARPWQNRSRAKIPGFPLAQATHARDNLTICILSRVVCGYTKNMIMKFNRACKPLLLDSSLDDVLELSEPEHQIDQYAPQQYCRQDARAVRIVVVDGASFAQFKYTVSVHSTGIGNGEQGRDGETTGRDHADCIVRLDEVQ